MQLGHQVVRALAHLLDSLDRVVVDEALEHEFKRAETLLKGS